MAAYRGKLHFGIHRTRTLTKERKESLLDQFGWVCQYCDEAASDIDHIIPWSWSQDDSDANLVASCRLCNLISGNKIFKGFADKRYYILNSLNRMARKGWGKVWCSEELEELGPRMRQAIACKCVVVGTFQERNRVQEILDQHRLKTRASLEYMLRRQMNVEPVRVSAAKTA